jgi:DNA polymerase-3 subunit delta'
MVQQAVARARVPHAYIFHGPEGVGKEMLARGLAQLVLCPQPRMRAMQDRDAALVALPEFQEGCGRCDDCRFASAGTHPDLHVVYRQLIHEHPESEIRKRKGLELGVEVIRNFVIDRVSLTPHRGRAKAFIIRGADEMNPQAQNALLKTLEEPPGTTFLILLASGLDHLLPTTQSRCQVVRFDALPAAFIESKLRELRPALPEEQLGWYRRTTEGSLGQALESVDNDGFSWNQRIVERLEGTGGLDSGGLVSVWTAAAEALGERFRKLDADISDTDALRRGLRIALRMTANWYADRLRAATNGADGGWEPCGARIRRVAEAEEQLELNVNRELCLETLANDLAESAGLLAGVHA